MTGCLRKGSICITFDCPFRHYQARIWNTMNTSSGVERNDSWKSLSLLSEPRSTSYSGLILDGYIPMSWPCIRKNCSGIIMIYCLEKKQQGCMDNSTKRRCLLPHHYMIWMNITAGMVLKVSTVKLQKIGKQKKHAVTILEFDTI